MDNQNRVSQQQRNPKTHAEHRREVFWQITLPMLLGVLLILAAVGVIVFLTVQPVTDVGRWADVSLMWLIFPSLFLAFLLLVILIGFIVLVTYILRLIPPYALIVQLYIEQFKGKLSQIFNLSVEPILKIKSLWTAARYAARLGKKEVQQ
jgi:hypothetical protein